MELSIRHGVRPSAGTVEVREMREVPAIARFLRTHRAYAAYALGQLEPPLFRRSRWWMAKGPGGEALLLHAEGGLGNAMLALGERRALEAIVSLHPGPRRLYATCQPEHLDALRRYYSFAQEQPMMRMAVTAGAFRPVRGETLRLRGVHVGELNRLYASEGTAGFYSERHIEEGNYQGIFVDGRLVAVAGTHVISSRQGIAVVGNVFTHPRYRGRGLGTLVTSAVTEDLLQICSDVVLTVDPRNAPAIHAYRRLGYVEECRLIEAMAERRDLLGLHAGLRRLVSRIRGRRHGTEIVTL